ncbi:MAG: hypothetical protein ACK5GN_12705 [Pseudomonadota bacterium]
MPVKLARLLLDITIGFCFDSHPRIDSVLQNSGFRYGLLENAIARIFDEACYCERRQRRFFGSKIDF